MADTKLKLEVIMAAVDRITGPLKAVMSGSKATSTEVKALRDRLKELNSQSGQIEGFRKLQSQTAVVGHNMAAAQAKVKQLANEIAAIEKPTKAMEKAFADAKREASALTTQHSEMTQRVQRQRDALNAAGLSTTSLASHQRSLRAEVKTTTDALDVEQKKLDGINQRAKQLHAARANYDKATATQGKLASTGVGAMATGGAIMFGLGHSIEQAGHYQKDMLRIKALGMGDHVVEDSDKFARGMHKYGTSMRDNIDLMRDGLTIFADLHHAEMAVPVMQKMKFANGALFGEKGNDKTEQLYDMLKVVELRGGAKDAKTFEAEANLIQKVMSSTGGRVGSKDYRDLIQTGGVATKQLNTDTFYNMLEPLIQEMGGHQVGTGLMSAFQNMYLGRSTTSAARTMGDLGLLKKDMVEYDKVGQIKRMKVGAIVGSETYKTNPFEWLDTHFLPALAKKGITDPSAVRDALASVMGSRTGAKVFTTYLDQKDQINKAAGRNRNAAGIDDTYAIATESIDGKKMALAKRFEDVQQLLGEKLLPLYSAMIDAVQAMTHGIANFAQAHPTLVTWLGYTAATIGVVLVTFGALALAIAAVLGPFALAKLAMTVMGFSGISLSGVLGGAITALKGLGTAVLWVGRLMLTNPIGLAVTAIATAAFLIYQYWEPIKAFFGNLWAGISSAATLAWGTITAGVTSAWSSITGGAASAWAYMSGLPAKFATIGAQVIDGFTSGLSQRFESAKEWFTTMGHKVAQATRDALGIKSPSRVFAEIGGHVMGGLTMGMDGSEEGPLQHIKALAAKVAALGAGITLGTGAMAMPIQIDSRPPLSAAASMGAAAASVSVVNQITIHAQPGMDEQALAKLVAQEIEKATRRTQVGQRSRLADNL